VWITFAGLMLIMVSIIDTIRRPRRELEVDLLLSVLAINVLVIYGLAAYGGRATFA
jgi:hypothetical protein